MTEGLAIVEVFVPGLANEFAHIELAELEIGWCALSLGSSGLMMKGLRPLIQ